MLDTMLIINQNVSKKLKKKPIMLQISNKKSILNSEIKLMFYAFDTTNDFTK